MKVYTEKSYENKKVRAKGKVFKGCYFEGCNIIDDEHTVYIDCFMDSVKTSNRSRGSNCILVRAV